jgi:hypothetical protein
MPVAVLSRRGSRRTAALRARHHKRGRQTLVANAAWNKNAAQLVSSGKLV